MSGLLFNVMVTAVVFVNTVTINTVSTGNVNGTILPCESIIWGAHPSLMTCGHTLPDLWLLPSIRTSLTFDRYQVQLIHDGETQV